MEKLLYTPREAALLLSLSRTKVYELIASGELDSIQVGRSRRIPAEALNAFVRACQEVFA